MGNGSRFVKAGVVAWVWLASLLVASHAAAQVDSVSEEIAEPPAGASSTTPDASESMDDSRSANAPTEGGLPDDRLGRDAGGVSRGQRLRALDTEIERLREERSQYGIGGPITMIALGGATVMVTALIASLRSSLCYDQQGCGEAPVGLYVAMGVGAGVGIWGGVLLAERLEPRRRLGKQIQHLEKEKEYIKYDARLAPMVGPGVAGARLSVAF